MGCACNQCMYYSISPQFVWKTRTNLLILKKTINMFSAACSVKFSIILRLTLLVRLFYIVEIFTGVSITHNLKIKWNILQRQWVMKICLLFATVNMRTLQEKSLLSIKSQFYLIQRVYSHTGLEMYHAKHFTKKYNRNLSVACIRI